MPRKLTPKKLRKPRKLSVANGKGDFVCVSIGLDRHLKKRLCLSVENFGEHFAACLLTAEGACKLGYRLLAFADYLDQQAKGAKR